MSDVDWIKIFEFIMPVILLLIGGFLAVDKMKRNIKLEAKLKWKEEFRRKVVDFVRESMELHNKSIFLKVNSEEKSSPEVASRFVDISQKFDSAFYAIDLMLKKENDNTHFLAVKYREIKDEVFEEFENESGSTQSDTINEFYELAKEIYNDEAYINRNL
ncbi:MAG: hypothetical protein HWD85_09090 [Flavobacteriaceae bacterium]|nr:hypothetical protein [Flavobacteriaceae bacterium]